MLFIFRELGLTSALKSFYVFFVVFFLVTITCIPVYGVDGKLPVFVQSIFSNFLPSLSITSLALSVCIIVFFSFKNKLYLNETPSLPKNISFLVFPFFEVSISLLAAVLAFLLSFSAAYFILYILNFNVVDFNAGYYALSLFMPLSILFLFSIYLVARLLFDKMVLKYFFLCFDIIFSLVFILVIFFLREQVLMLIFTIFAFLGSIVTRFSSQIFIAIKK